MMSCGRSKRVIPAGLYHTVLASSAIAAPPANAVPNPEPFCSASAKNDAEAGAEIPAIAAASADLFSRRLALDFILFSSFSPIGRGSALTIAQGPVQANRIPYATTFRLSERGPALRKGSPGQTCACRPGDRLFPHASPPAPCR